MSTNYFRFYKVQKNEDAEPYVYVDAEEKSGLIAVADGLGGSGSFVHVIEEQYKKGDFAETLKTTFLPEYFTEKTDSNKQEVVALEEKETCVEDLEEVISEGKEAVINEAEGSELDKQELDEEFRSWIDEMVKPMSDEASDTSALWGSRIAIARTVYYLRTNGDLDLSNEIERAKLVKFVYQGLLDTQKGFELKDAEISGQSTLPTTLVAIRYKEMEDGLNVEVIWAGDSRGHALIPGKGLVQLTVDDEDSSGAINNLFAISKGRGTNTILRYKAYKLPKGSAIFACSDGFFDPFDPIDNIGVEEVMLKALKDAQSFEEFAQLWHAEYKPTTHDDCSISFVAFDEFEGFKNTYFVEEEYNKLVKAQKDYFANKDLFSVIDGSVDAKAYVEERAQDVKERILQEVASAVLTDSNDAVVTQGTKDVLENLKEFKKEEKAQRLERAQEAKCNELIDCFKNGKIDAMVLLAEQRKQFPKLDKKLSTITDLQAKIASTKSEIQKIDMNMAQWENDKKEAEQTGDELVNRGSVLGKDGRKYFGVKGRIRLLEAFAQECSRRISEGKSIISRSPVKLNENDNYRFQQEGAIRASEKNHRDYQETLKQLRKIIQYWERKEVPMFGRPKFIFQMDGEIYDNLEKSIREYKTAESSLNKLGFEKTKKENELKRAQKDLETEYDGLKECLESFIKNVEQYFTEEEIQKYGLNVSVADEEVTASELQVELEAVFDEIMEAFKASTQSVIDRCFNVKRLALYRATRNVDVEEVKRILVELETMLEKYNY